MRRSSTSSEVGRGMRCIICGEGPGDPTYGYMCGNCFIERNAPHLPSTITISRCVRCGRVRGGRRWTSDLLGAVSSRVNVGVGPFKVAAVHTDGRSIESTLRPLPSKDGVEVIRRTMLRYKKDTCPRCRRMRGGYYEAVVQVRGSCVEGACAEVVSSIEGSNEENAFVAKQVKVRGGVDIYVGSWRCAERAARSVALAHGGEFRSSRELHTRRAGRNVYRAAYLVRIPIIGEGDVFEYRGSTYIFLHAKGRTSLARDISTWRETEVPVPASGITPLAREKDARPAVVVSEGEHELQVLDPDTMLVREVPRPGGLPCGACAGGREVRIVKIDGQMFIYST